MAPLVRSPTEHFIYFRAMADDDEAAALYRGFLQDLMDRKQEEMDTILEMSAEAAFTPRQSLARISPTGFRTPLDNRPHARFVGEGYQNATGNQTSSVVARGGSRGPAPQSSHEDTGQEHHATVGGITRELASQRRWCPGVLLNPPSCRPCLHGKPAPRPLSCS